MQCDDQDRESNVLNHSTNVYLLQPYTFTTPLDFKDLLKLFTVLTRRTITLGKKVVDIWTNGYPISYMSTDCQNAQNLKELNWSTGSQKYRLLTIWNLLRSLQLEHTFEGERVARHWTNSLMIKCGLTSLRTLERYPTWPPHGKGWSSEVVLPCSLQLISWMLGNLSTWSLWK